MTPINLYEAYAAVYDEDLRQELLVVEDDLSFVDDLSDNELVQIMEEIFTEGEFDLNECVELLDSELLSEETEMERMNRLQNKATRERKSAAATAKREKSAERERVGRKHAVKRLQVAATRAARNLKSGVKTKAAGAASAAMGGAAEAGRKLSSAKEKVKGFLKGVRDTVSGAAKKAYDRVSGREAKRTALKKAAYNRRKEQRAAAAKKAVSEPKAPKRQGPGKGFKVRPSDPWRGSATTPSASSKPSTTSTRALTGSPERKALPASGQSSAPKAEPKKTTVRVGNRTVPVKSKPGVRIAGPAGTGQVSTPQATKKGVKTAQGAVKKRMEKMNVNASYEMIADMIAEQLVSEGYAYDIIEAYDIILEMDDINIDEIVESVENYLTEGYDEYEVGEEALDVYDVVLNHLLDEGYADSIESAESIMANMSEEWREDIMEISDRMVNALKKARVRRTDRSLMRGDGEAPGTDFPGNVSKETRMNARIQARNQRTGSNVEPSFTRRHQ